jgi:hypothetical protein
MRARITDQDRQYIIDLHNAGLTFDAIHKKCHSVGITIAISTMKTIIYSRNNPKVFPNAINLYRNPYCRHDTSRCECINPGSSYDKYTKMAGSQSKQRSTISK